MKPLLRVLGAAAVVSTLAFLAGNRAAQTSSEAASSGATLYSALLVPGGGTTDVLRCSAVNVGSSRIRRVRVEILGTGHPLASGTCPDVGPNEECAVVDDSTLAGHCKVTASGGLVRGQFQILDQHGDNKALLPL